MKRKLNKKKMISAIILLLSIFAITMAIIISTANKTEKINGVKVSSEFSNLKPQNINIHYDEEKNETKITITIKNQAKKVIEKETINVMLRDEQDSPIAGMQTYIQKLEAKGEKDVTLTLLGDLTQIKSVTFEKPEETPKTE